MLSLFIQFMLVAVTSQNLVEDIVKDTDRFADRFGGGDLDDIIRESEKFKLLIKRSYGLVDEEHVLGKRSLSEETKLIRDDKGVYLIQRVNDFFRVPAKFPLDIQIISAQNRDLIIAALESDEDLPQSKLANQLVLYKLKEDSCHELARTEVSGGYKLAAYTFRNVTYIMASEHNAECKNPFEGSSLYSLFPYQYDIAFKKVQILNITHPKDVQFWEHQDKMYLGVGTGSDRDEKSYVLIFKWLGHNFDFIQKIETSSVKSVTPFVMGSSMYLAVANHEDVYGNTNTDSHIYRFNLQKKKFILHQSLQTQAANDIAHFKFMDSKSKKEEHFIVVANNFEKEQDGSRKYRTDSVIYKFEDDHFVPFQNFKLYGALQWVPVTGSHEEFLLLAVCSYTVIGYQYDGWRFKEISLDYGQSPFGKNISSMRSFHHNRNIYLYVADRHNDGTAVNMWTVTFEKENHLEKKYAEVQRWCNEMKSTIESDDLDTKVKYLHAHLQNPDLNSLGVKIELPTANIDVLETESFDVYNAAMIDDLNNLNGKLKKLREELHDLAEKLEKTEFTMYYDVRGLDEISYLELDCPREECCEFKNLNIGTLNSVDFVSFINNSITLNENIIDFKMEFENLIVTHDLKPIELNGHPVETLVDTQTDMFLNSELIVNGTVIIQGDLHVNEEYVMCLKTEEDILRASYQNFTGDLILETARVKNLVLSGKLNGVKIEKLFMNNTKSKLEDVFEKLNVQDLFVNGSVTGFNTSYEQLNSLDGKNATDLEFDILELEDIYVKTGVVSGVRISDIVQITEGKYYKLAGEVNFTQSVFEPNFLEVKESINESPIENFQNEHCSQISESNIIIVEGTAFLKDIVDPEGKYSIRDIMDKAILINTSVISTKLDFDEIKIDNFDVESINGIPVSSWILKQSEKVQIIRGKKTFLGDVQVSKSVNVKQLNGIDLEEFYNDTLLLDGEQTITGDMNFNEIKAVRLSCDFISLNGEELKLGQQNLRIVGPVIVDTLTAENVTLNGVIKGLPWGNVIQDPLYVKSSSKPIKDAEEPRRIEQGGTFNEITTDEEEVREFEIPHGVSLNSTLYIDHITFEGSLDSIPKSSFGKEWLLTEGNQTINGHIIFNDVKLESGATLENETLNNVNLKNVFKNSLKVNESIHIKHLVVTEIKANRIDVEGTVNGAKFEDSVLVAKSNTPQIVQGEWFINKDLIINGSLKVDGLVSGINLTELFRLQASKPDEINLIVGGSVRFTKEPKILLNVNGINLEETVKKVWFKNEDVVLGNGIKKFCNVEFHGLSNLKGYLNDVDLEELSKNYFSKSSARIVLEKVKVRNLMIRKPCVIHNVQVGGRVNGINLEKFTKAVLLQDEDQIITGKYHFHEFTTRNLILNGTISGLDLMKGVLRYDVSDAVVTGEKTFLNLSVRNMTIAKGKRVQEVDVDDWARRVVRKKGNFNITGNLILHRPVFSKNLKILGTVNDDLIFDSDHILLVTGNQTITGKKIFDLSNYPNETLRIRHLIANSFVSGINLGDLIENQALNDGNLLFTGKKIFTGEINAENLIVKGLFQNENITAICSNLSQPLELSDFTESYENLLEKAENINKHFKEKPYFLDYFEALQTLNDDVFALLPYLSKGQGMVSLITSSEIRLMEWDPFIDQFAFKEDNVLSLVDNVTFATFFPTKSGSYLYLEISNVTQIFGSDQRIQMDIDGTSCVAPFELASLNKSCIFIGREWNDSKIMCSSSVSNDLETFQPLVTLGTLKASTLQVGDDIYITAINKEKMVDRVENILTVYKFDKEFKSFYVSSILPEINPVAVSTITYKNINFLVLAGGHLPESVDTSIITIFRLNKENNIFVRYQSLLVDTPVDVHFAQLPTSELVLYVLSLNPSKPFIVFLYKGIQGFVEKTSGPSLYVGNKIDSFTDFKGEHFVFISGYGRGQILRAGFKGNKVTGLINYL